MCGLVGIEIVTKNTEHAPLTRRTFRSCMTDAVRGRECNRALNRARAVRAVPH